MSATLSATAAPAEAYDPDRYRDKSKLDQWICWYVIPIFYNLFGLIYFWLTRMMPPQTAVRTPEGAAHFFRSHSLHIQIGFGTLMIVIGMSNMVNGLVAYHMKRMSVSPVFSYAYIASLAVGALPGCLISAFTFLTAAFRPDRDPHQMLLLYDIGFLTFIGSLGCFSTQYLILAIAIFLDKKKVFPNWLAYLSIWQIVTEIIAGLLFFFKDGPFAWDGSISFYEGTAIFIVYLSAFIMLLRKAIQDAPPGETVQD